ncbi:MAG: YabP/YqfC family sporulation protein [Sarcina sp.]
MNIKNNDLVSSINNIIKGFPKIEIKGKTEILIENHNGILMLDSDIVRLKTKLGILNIYGENFSLLFMSGNTLVIGGEFRSLEYEGGYIK